MVIRSKFRTLFWLKIIFLLLTSILLANQCFKAATTYDGSINFEYPPSWIGILLIIFILLILISLISLHTLTVDSEKIHFDYFILRTQKTIYIKDIIEIERIKIRRIVRSGEISDGYHETNLVLADGSSKNISRDYFENHTEIIHFIKSKTTT
jgi:hypothetical protein